MSPSGSRCNLLPSGPHGVRRGLGGVLPGILLFATAAWGLIAAGGCGGGPTLCQSPGGVDIRLVLATPGEYGQLSAFATGTWGMSTGSSNVTQCSDALTGLPPAIESNAVDIAPANQQTENTIAVQDNLRNGLWTFTLNVTGTGFPEMNGTCSVEIFATMRTIVTFTEGSNACTSASGGQIP